MKHILVSCPTCVDMPSSRRLICLLPTARTLCHAFVKSESAEAHLHLFKRLCEIAAKDAGEEPSFHYIHGKGIRVVVGDEHKGQAQGEQL